MKLASLIDAKKKKVLIIKFKNVKNVIGIVLFVFGVLGFCIMVREDVSPRNYVDENALMPGYVAFEFSGSNAAEVDRVVRDLATTQLQDQDTWLATVKRTLVGIGLDVHTQNFTASLPHLRYPVNGSNLYASLKAQRASGIEALVIHVPLENVNAVSFAIAFAKFCKGKVIWAKDLVFLFTSGEELGPQAWVEAYLGIDNSELHREQLHSRSGSIQAAITLDINTLNINHVDISTVSQNGLLPNQDIFNALVVVCNKNGMSVTFDGQGNRENPYSAVGYIPRLKTLMRMVTLQASGQQSGLHGAFVRYHIDALTIRTRGPSGVNTAALTNFGRCVEGLLRSMNNLLEKLHHSFYTFLTLSSNKYLSISWYLPPLVLILSPPLLDLFAVVCYPLNLTYQCIALWFIGNQPHLLSPTGADNVGVEDSYAPFPVKYICAVFLYGATVGCAMYCVPLVLWWLDLLEAHTLTYTLVAMFSVFSILPVLHRVEVTDTQWRLLKFLCNLLLVTVMVALAVLNYSLSFIIAVFVSLPLMFTRPTSSKESLFLFIPRILSLVLASPVMLPIITLFLYHFFYIASEEESFVHLLSSTEELFVTGVLATYINHWVLHLWYYQAVCLGFIPLWTVLWCIAQHRTPPLTKTHKD